MNNFIRENILSDYFLMETILKKHCPKLRVFQTLADIYKLDKVDADELYTLVSSPDVEEIRSYADYTCYTRIKNYKDFIGEARPFSVEDDNAVTIKGEAILAAAKNNLSVEKDQSVSAVYSTLSEAANKGSVIALKVLGILRCEGLVFEKNLSEGCKNLAKAAKWCDKTAILAIIKYEERTRKNYISKLRVLVENTPYGQLYETCSTVYGVKAEEGGEEVKLLNKIFARGFIKYEIFDSAYAKLIYSPAIALKDKRRILFSGDNALVAETCALPLKSDAAELSVDVRALTDMPVLRAKEQSSLKKALLSVDLRSRHAYRPICINCNSDYLAERYVNSIGGCFADANVIMVDASSLREYDLEPTKNNVFVRMLDENRANVVIISMRGRVPDAVSDAVADFLRSEKREAFSLLKPAVTLDLSDVLPIVVSDAFNSGAMKLICDVISIADVKSNEKSAVVREIAARKGAYYSVDTVTVDEAAEKKLSAMTPEKIEMIIDDIVREERLSAKNVVVTAQAVDMHPGSSSGSNKYGFNA